MGEQGDGGDGEAEDMFSLFACMTCFLHCLGFMFLFGSILVSKWHFLHDSE